MARALTHRFAGLSPAEASAFADRWLPAWTGGDGLHLASFYAPDGFYRDPYADGGISGKDALTRYFCVLLAANPDWVWTQIRATPLEGGFLNHWHARIPTAHGTVDCEGVCTVILDNEGRIARNEVHFDLTPLNEPTRRKRR